MANLPERSSNAPRTNAVAAALALLVLCIAGEAAAQHVRDYISIVGSSTVYPFATVVAEQFGRGNKYKTPKVESTGSGGGIKLFCAGIGVQFPDVANSSRRITPGEVAGCARNGVRDVVEVRIGYDGIVIAASRSTPSFVLSLPQVFLGLAKNVPDPDGGDGSVPNPYQQWSDIDPELPAARIEVLGPPPTSGTRDAFLELAMEGGCKTFAQYRTLSGDDLRAACHPLREDGRYIEAGENDNLIVQKLESNPRALGIFGYSFLEQNTDKVQALSIGGIEPTFDTIADGSYPISRPLFFYVKKAHVGTIPGIREYLAEFMSDSASGELGYLADKGLVPLPAAERAQVVASVRALETLVLDGSH